MSVIPLTGETRDRTGKGSARKARAAGKIPGVVYGHGETPVPVVVDARDFQLALRHHKGGNAIVNLTVGGGEHTALIRDVHYDPLSREILHLDFQRISLTETVEVRVTLHLTGLPVGVKDGGGVLEHITREIEVRCLPTAIPAFIDVDVSGLAVGQSVHVRDIQVTDMTVLTEPDVTVATVAAPTVIEEVVAAPEAAEGAAEPEVITKGKKEEGVEGEDKDKEKDKEKDKKETKEKEKS